LKLSETELYYSKHNIVVFVVMTVGIKQFGTVLRVEVSFTK